MRVSAKAKEAIRSLEVGVPGSCEQLNVGTGLKRSSSVRAATADLLSHLSKEEEGEAATG